MTGTVTVTLDELRVEGAREPERFGRLLGPVLEQAMQILAERLRRHAADADLVQELYLDALTLGVRSADDILGPRGAELIADLVWDRLLAASRSSTTGAKR